MISDRNDHLKVTFKKSLSVLLGIQLLFSGCSPKVAGNQNNETAQNAAGKEFSIAVLPDTQYYTSERHGGKNTMFKAQTEWIVKNAAKENIAYVIHLGDISDTGEKFLKEWTNAADAMYALDKPQPGYPQGIPYGLAVGNHDQTKSQYPISGKTDQYNKYFGIAHFKDKKYYGGHYKDNNDSHYDLFSAGGTKFIVIYVEYDSYDEDMENMNSWTVSLLEKYADRKAIIVSHFILGNNTTAGTNEKGFAPYGKQGKRLYDRIKRSPNVFMMLCGHVGGNGEGYRQDFYAGSAVKSFLSDYQSRQNGGDGLMRLIKFSKEKDLISVRTFSPYTGVEEKDDDSEFTKPWLHNTNTARYLDFNSDQTTEAVFFNAGKWNINGVNALDLGKEGDIAVPADYNGDGKTEMAVFRPSEGMFYVQGGKAIKFGKEGDIPVPGDYDGDGYADFAVYRPSDMAWYIKGLGNIKFGDKKGIPVPADYDGDGITDAGIFRTDNSFWQIAGMGNIPLNLVHIPGDIPVPADYDGDGRAEMAVYRPATGEWIIDKMKQPIKLGQSGDVPVPGNYFKDGKAYPAVYRNNKLILQNSVIDLKEGDLKTLVNLPYAISRSFF